MVARFEIWKIYNTLNTFKCVFSLQQFFISPSFIRFRSETRFKQELISWEILGERNRRFTFWFVFLLACHDHLMIGMSIVL
jgi:hypothetical protein